MSGLMGPAGFRDEGRRETWCVAGAAWSGGACCGVGEAVVDDGGDVVGVGKPAGPDEAWQESVDVVVVGFGTAQLRGQRPEGIGIDAGFCLVGDESASGDGGGTAVVLGCGGNGFVFDGE